MKPVAKFGVPEVDVPRVCLLDPDGDIIRHLQAAGQGVRHPGWACYHTEMWVTDLHGLPVGVVGLAVGAPFAVLVAEQLSASGAELILSITSAGQIRPLGDPSYFVLITKALRDEGTSHHYLPPSEWGHLAPDLEEVLLRQRTSTASRWRQRPSTPTGQPGGVLSCASPTSPTRWRWMATTSKRVAIDALEITEAAARSLLVL